MADDRMLRVSDVARLLGVSPSTVRRWITSGQLLALRLGSERAHYRVRFSQLQAFYDQQRSRWTEGETIRRSGPR